MDIGWASEKVRRLIDKHLETEGIKQNVEEVSIFSEDFPIKINSPKLIFATMLLFISTDAFDTRCKTAFILIGLYYYEILPSSE